MNIRLAGSEDRSAFYALWQQNFGTDSPSFVDWFFSARFVPEYSVLAEEGGRAVACAHGMPLHIGLRDKIVPAVMLAGVATHEDFRGKGLMHQIMSLFMRVMHDRGIPLVAHTPARLPTFFSIGHYPVNDTQYAIFEANGERASASFCRIVDPAEHYGALFQCYDRSSRRYSGMIRRSFADFVLKCADYGSTGSKCAVARGASGIEGYYFFESDECGNRNAMECVADNDAVFSTLLRDFSHRTRGQSARFRLPPDVAASCPGARFECAPKSVVGVANVAALLKPLGLSGHSVEVLDPFVPENAGRYRLDGEKTDAQAEISLSAGRLAQWALGYKSVGQLVESGDATLFAPDVSAAMDVLSPLPCYVIDEY